MDEKLKNGRFSFLEDNFDNIDIIIICLLILLFNGNIKINIHGKVLEQDIATSKAETDNILIELSKDILDNASLRVF